MEKVYSNLPYKKVYLYRSIAFMSVISLVIMFFISLYYKEISFITIVVLFFWTSLVYLMPLLILYFNYKNNNKNSILKIYNNTITFNNKTNEQSFKIDDINAVELNLSIPLYYNRWRLFYWDEFYYALILLKSGEELVITCLLCDELERYIPINLIKRRERVFPLIELRQENKEKLNDENIRIERKTQDFILKFRDKSESELKEIIANKNEYQREAIIAAKKLLEKK